MIILGLGWLGRYRTAWVEKVCMYFYAVFNSESKDKIDCGRFWFDFFSCFFFRWDMFSSPHIGTVAFNQKWVPLIFCSLFVLEILFCVFAKLKVLFRNAPRLQICDPRSFSQIELLSCLVYEKSLGHDWGLAALNSWMNYIKSWSIFKTAIGQADHLGHYRSKSILVEVIRSSSKELLLLRIGNEINLPPVHIWR